MRVIFWHFDLISYTRCLLPTKVIIVYYLIWKSLFKIIIIIHIEQIIYILKQVYMFLKNISQPYLAQRRSLAHRSLGTSSFSWGSMTFKQASAISTNNGSFMASAIALVGFLLFRMPFIMSRR